MYERINRLEFNTALDVFGGTGVVSYLFKILGKSVTYNDILRSNYTTGLALIENQRNVLLEQDILFLSTKQSGHNYPDFIEQTFPSMYYTDDENVWIDVMIENINLLSSKYNGKTLRYKKALAFYSLYQTCLMKRPYNLFHRNNLSMRLRDVNRSFGNYKTWSIPAPELFARQANKANNFVFDNGVENKAQCIDALNIESNDYDLVYLDPPYFNIKGQTNDYLKMYHFIEGMTRYEEWPSMIDYNSPILSINNGYRQWGLGKDEKPIDSFKSLCQKFKNSIIVVSYKTPGSPTIDELQRVLNECGKKVEIDSVAHSYALCKNNSVQGNREVLLIGK